MPSPFPGMNPYLEAIWHDFHERFLPAAAAYLVPQIRPRYFVSIDEIELLSPTNKRPGEHRAQYLAKRSAVRHSDVHLVEIDLLRGGPPMPAEGRPGCTYAVLVSRVDQRSAADFWPFGLRDPLPTILVPLRPGDGDARLDLRAILDRVYDESAYEDYIYQSAPDPPLTPDDGICARAFLPRPVD